MVKQHDITRICKFIPEFTTTTVRQWIASKLGISEVYVRSMCNGTKLSSAHTNMLGCYRVPVGYIAEDLNWSADVVKNALAELSAIDFLTYDADYNWIFLHNFLKYNPIENPNQAKSISKLFNDVPKNLSFFTPLINSLLEHNSFFQDEFINSLETLAKPFRNQEQEQYQKQEIVMSGKPDVAPCSQENIDDKKHPSS